MHIQNNRCDFTYSFRIIIEKLLWDLLLFKDNIYDLFNR